MTYEEWLEHLQYKLKKKYKVTSINCGTCGMRINFVTQFAYGIYDGVLKDMWMNDQSVDGSNDVFNRMCKDIENAYINQIKNI